jgi:inner membrane protein
LDTITHGLIGILGSKTGFSQRNGKLAAIAFLIGAVFPDIDIVVSFFGPEFSLRYHRGITHSIVAAPVFALVIGAVIYRFASFKNFFLLSLIVALGIYSHIFFDLITSYGTVIFDPISMKRYSWNLVFIIDPFITIPVILGLILCWKRGDRALMISVSILSFLAVYLMLNLCVKLLYEEKLEGFAAASSIAVERSTVYPRPLAPFFWMGVIETEDAFYRLDYSILRKAPVRLDKIAKTKGNIFIDRANYLTVTNLFKWFADYPIADYTEVNGEHIVRYYDLRFNIIPKRNPFNLTIVFSSKGALKNVSLNGRKVRMVF